MQQHDCIPELDIGADWDQMNVLHQSKNLECLNVRV
jgi:hypothetical protein